MSPDSLRGTRWTPAAERAVRARNADWPPAAFVDLIRGLPAHQAHRRLRSPPQPRNRDEDHAAGRSRTGETWYRCVAGSRQSRGPRRSHGSCRREPIRHRRPPPSATQRGRQSNRPRLPDATAAESRNGSTLERPLHLPQPRRRTTLRSFRWEGQSIGQMRRPDAPEWTTAGW